MTVPITGFTINDILGELDLPINSSIEIEDLFLTSNITPEGLDAAYCAGATTTAKLNNLRTKPYEIGKWRNYTKTTSGIDTFDIVINKGGTLYKLDPVTFTVTLLANGYESSPDIAITSNRLWVTGYSSIYGTDCIFEYSLTTSPFSTTLLRVIPGQGRLGNGLGVFDNNTLFVGGGAITFLDISNPIVVLSEIGLDDSVTGDILYDPLEQVIFVTVTKDLLLGGYEYYIKKYNLAGVELASREFYNDDAYALFLDPSNNVYLIRSNGDLYSIDRYTLSFTLIKNIGLSGLDGAAQIKYIAP